jgi:hypothetical protein
MLSIYIGRVLVFLFFSVRSEGDSGKNVNILGGDSICHCQLKVHVNMHVILNVYRACCLNLQMDYHCEWQYR